jgi:hypothetical protein
VIYDLLATTFELLPARVDFVSFVLQGAGFAGLFGTAVALRARRRKARAIDVRPLVERYTLLGAAGGGLAFLILLLAQELH